jgi:hypothetical protein
MNVPRCSAIIPDPMFMRFNKAPSFQFRLFGAVLLTIHDDGCVNVTYTADGGWENSWWEMSDVAQFAVRSRGTFYQYNALYWYVPTNINYPVSILLLIFPARNCNNRFPLSTRFFTPRSSHTVFRITVRISRSFKLLRPVIPLLYLVYVWLLLHHVTLSEWLWLFDPIPFLS